MAILRSNISRADVRRVARKPMSYPAWIELGNGAPPRPCVILDITEIGAKLSAEGANALPEAFTLVLAVPGPRRNCRAIWRSANEVGVSFVLSVPAAAPVPSHGATEATLPHPPAPAAAITAELDC
ncbi:MAG TPA: hypothetical protein VFB45_13995 [Pseudolabrys sp.]|nr:hypothetical protein [Pseudolabrys sp.]